MGTINVVEVGTKVISKLTKEKGTVISVWGFVLNGICHTGFEIEYPNNRHTVSSIEDFEIE